MKRLMLAALLTMLSLAASAAEPVADEAVFVEGARYDAVLRRQEQSWRLLPAEGRDVKLRVAESCHAGSPPPRGLWLLTTGRDGSPTLLAPSATPLPAGHPGEVVLVPCGQPLPTGTPALAVPEALVAWLAEHSGAVYVAD